MVYPALTMLVLAALACFGLNRLLATRLLGFIAAGAAAAAALALVAWRGQLPAPGEMAALLSLQLDATGLAVGLTLLGGGALALLALSLSVPVAVRGFGGLFGWSLLAVASTLAGLAARQPSLLIPMSWAAAALTAYAAAFSSGTLNQGERLPQGVTLGLLASLVGTGALVAAGPELAAAGPAPAALLFVAALMLVGGAPFHGAFAEASEAPEALAGLLMGLVLPVVSMATLIQVFAQLPPLQSPWRAALLALALITALAAAAGALRERSLRRLVGWQSSSQAALVGMAVLLDGPAAALAAPALLISLALSTVGATLAASALGPRGGSDDYTQARPGAELRAPGLIWAAAAVGALGLPPLWGFWGRRWLLEAAMAQAPWLIAPLLAAGVLATLAWLAPLAAFWRAESEVAAPAGAGPWPPGFHLQALLALVSLAPLLLLGLAPQLAWPAWLAAVPGAPPALPAGPLSWLAVGGAAAMGVLLAARSWRRPPARPIPRDPDVEPVALAPDALGQSLGPLAALAWPPGGRAWEALQTASRGARAVMALFERRYYLAGVLLALLCVIVLMAQ